ncbi:MYG1 family protein [Pseudoroseomonas wenyumeiae]
MVARIAENVRYKFVRHVDLVDNGVERTAPTDLTALVDAFNSTWDEPSQSDPAAFEARQLAGFLRASRMVAVALEQQVEKERGTVFASQAVARAWEDCRSGITGLHPDLLELPRGMPWQRTAFELALPILYVMSPEPDGRWKLQAMPAEKGSLRNRLDMPEAWRGLQDAALEQACGIPGAVFVHRNGHLAIAATRDAALDMARACLASRPSPAEALRKAWGGRAAPPHAHGSGSGIEYGFATQEHRLALFVRTTGIARVQVKIGLRRSPAVSGGVHFVAATVPHKVRES